jgi:electron transport complex protein RnfC
VQSFTEVLVETGKFAGKTVHAGCNTLYVNGFQGLTPACHNCAQCGTCYLNYTAGICPVTACSKGLLNGQCGGCKNGKCEVDKEMDCGWEKIFNKLNKTGKLDNKVHLRNFKIVP